MLNTPTPTPKISTQDSGTTLKPRRKTLASFERQRAVGDHRRSHHGACNNAQLLRWTLLWLDTTLSCRRCLNSCAHCAAYTLSLHTHISDRALAKLGECLVTVLKRAYSESIAVNVMLVFVKLVLEPSFVCVVIPHSLSSLSLYSIGQYKHIPGLLPAFPGRSFKPSRRSTPCPCLLRDTALAPNPRTRQDRTFGSRGVQEWGAGD